MLNPRRRPIKPVQRVQRPVLKKTVRPAGNSLPAAPKKCLKCQEELEPGATFCGACGAPVRAGVKPRRSLAEVRKKILRGKNAREISAGRDYLMYIGAINLVAGIGVYIFYKSSVERLLSLPLDDPIFRQRIADKMDAAEFEKAVWFARHWGALCFMSYGLPGMIFLGLYQWAQSNPLPATVAGMITYLTVTIASVALDPAILLSGWGWVWRITVISALGAAIQASSSERRIKEKEAHQERARRRALAAENAAAAEEEG